MKISMMDRIMRPVAATLIVLLMLVLIDIRAVAQERTDGKGRIENAVWTVTGDVVFITYDLIGDASLTYDVAIVLTRERDKSFRIVPKTVSGAVGEGKFAGLRQEIRWEYKKDVLQGLSGDDYQFEFAVNIVKGGGISSTWYYVGGGLVVVGAVVAAVIGGGGGGGGTETQSGLPSPPTTKPPSQ